jgi:hypothetical protein
LLLVVSIEPPKERKRLLGPGDNLPGAFLHVELREGDASRGRIGIEMPTIYSRGALRSPRLRMVRANARIIGVPEAFADDAIVG